MRDEVLLAVVSKLIEKRLGSFEPAPGPKGDRGLRGRDGRDGQDFIWSEHEDEVRAWAKQYALKFEDLDEAQLASLKGKDGTGFKWSEHEETILAFIQDRIPTFNDFSAEQIELIRGPRGRSGVDGRNGTDGRNGLDGVDGRSFIFDEHQEKIQEIIRGEIEGLKVRFEDLTEDERMSLRGPRGQRGKPGKDFVFEEHQEYFDSLKLRFSDLTDEEKGNLKLRFSDLTDEERVSLTLKFDQLSDDEKNSLRGARGQRGKNGSPGVDGIGWQTAEGEPTPDTVKGNYLNSLTGEIYTHHESVGWTKVGSLRGIRGLPGVAGKNGVGFNGKDGADGIDGKDAPRVTDIRVDQTGDRFELVFDFDDLSRIRTNSVKLPNEGGGHSFIVVGGGGGSGGGSGTGTDGKSAYEIAVDNGFVGTESDWLLSLKGTDGIDGTNGTDGIDGMSAYEVWLSQGNTGTEADFLNSLKGADGAGAGEDLETYVCDTDVYPGAAVSLRMENMVSDPISIWPNLSAVLTLDSETFDVVAYNGIANDYEDANVIGLVESKPTPTTCLVRKLGTTAFQYFGLNIQKDYFLSAHHPGALVSSDAKPSAPGEYRVRIGRPVNPRNIYVSRGDIIPIVPGAPDSNTLGWRFIQDSTYTQANPFLVTAGDTVFLPNDAAGSQSNSAFAPPEAAYWYNPINSRFYPTIAGETYLLRVNLTMVPALNNKSVEFMFDIGATNPLWQDSDILDRGAGVAIKRSMTIPIGTGQTMLSNGGGIKITSDTDLAIYRISTFISRIYKPGVG